MNNNAMIVHNESACMTAQVNRSTCNRTSLTAARSRGHLEPFHCIIELLKPLKLLLRSEDFTRLNVALELHQTNEWSKSCAFLSRLRLRVVVGWRGIRCKCQLLCFWLAITDCLNDLVYGR